jgi:peptidyl-prolyl cis-trans isomerase D
VLGDDVRADKVNKLLSGPGYVLPADVKQQLKRSDTTWTLATATADYAAFSPEIKPTDAELTKAFEEAGGRYDIPPQVVTSYVDFSTAAYLAQVNPTEAEVRAFYDANPARFPKPAAPTPPAALTPVVTPPADPSADFAAVRAQVESTLKQERAQQLATKAASDFAVKLYDGKVTSHAALETFLAREKITPKALPPFPRNAPPAELGGSPEAAEQAFRLNDGRVVSGAIPTPNGAAVLFWKETLPSRKPLFAEVREKVSADFIENEKRKRFIELGRTAKTQIEARLKAGDTFEKAAAAAAGGTGLKIESKAIPAFTLRNRPQDLDYNIEGALSRLEQGQVSDMIGTPDNKGIFVYAAEKKAPDLTESNPAYIETRNQLAGITGRIGASTYIAEMVDKELKRSEPKVQ